MNKYAPSKAICSQVDKNTTCKVTKQHLAKENVVRISFSLAIIFIVAMIVIKPNLCINSVYNGLLVWAKCVLPSLFPFMFLTKILTDLNFVSKLTNKFSKLTSTLFCAPKISAYIFLMSVISGYPVGAKMICEFYEAGIISNKQANKLTTFCSTSGPLFIIGSVGTALFLNAKLGYIMFLSHVLASMLNGVLYRKMYVDKTEKEFEISNKTSLNDILPNSISSSIMSILIVGGYIAIFFLIIDLFNELNLFFPLNFLLSKIGFNIETAKAISSGLVEMSKGCVMLSKLSLPTQMLGTIASFLIGFGGISTFFQATTFLSKCKVNCGFYLLQKLTYATISAFLTFLLCFLI